MFMCRVVTLAEMVIFHQPFCLVGFSVLNNFLQCHSCCPTTWKLRILSAEFWYSLARRNFKSVWQLPIIIHFVHSLHLISSVQRIARKKNVLAGHVSLSKKPCSTASARKQRFAGSREECCGIRLRGSVPQPQSSPLALPCQILVSVDGCQSLAAFGSCIHWMRAPSRRPITPAGTGGKRVPSGHNRRRRLATRRCDTKRAGTAAVVLRDD